MGYTDDLGQNELLRRKRKEEEMQMHIQEEQQMDMQQQVEEHQNGILEEYHSDLQKYREQEEIHKNDKASKWESKDKKQARKERALQLKTIEEKQKNFYQPMDEISDAMLMRMDNLLEQQKENGTEVSCQDISKQVVEFLEAEKNKDEEEPFNVDGIIFTEEESHLQLCNMFRILSETNANALTQEKAKELTLQYKRLCDKDRVKAGASQYLFGKMEYTRPGDIGVPVAYANPEACRVLLLNCVAVALRERINYVDKEKVNMKNFAKLCGIAEATTIAVSHMLIHADYMNEYEEQLARENQMEIKQREQRDQEELEMMKKSLIQKAKEDELKDSRKLRADYMEKVKEEKKFRKEEEERLRKEEEERLRREEEERLRREEEERVKRVTEERLPVIAKLVNGIAKEGMWPKEYLYELIKNMIGDTISSKEEELFFKEIHKFREKLQTAMARVQNFLNKNEDLYLSMGLLKERICAEVVVKMGENLFEETNKEMDKEQEVKLLQTMKEHELVQKWTFRKKAFEEALKNNKVNYVEAEIEGFWQNSDIQRLIMDLQDDEQYQLNIRELAKQASENSIAIKNLVKSNFFDINGERAEKQIRKYMGSSWITGSPNVVRATVMNFIANMNLLDSKLSHREAMLKAMVKEFKLEGFEEAMTKTIKGFSSELYGLDVEEMGEENAELAKKQLSSFR